MVGIIKEIDGQKKIVPLTSDTGTGAGTSLNTRHIKAFAVATYYINQYTGERMGKKKTENAEVRRGEIEARIRELVSELGAPNSAVGDWKVIKCYEASLAGHELPYDITELMKARQAVRDEINTLQAELETLQGAE